MQKIAGPGATASGEFTEGNPHLSLPSTYVTAAWANSVQRELIGVLTEAGLLPDDADDEQVRRAISKISADAAESALSDRLLASNPSFERGLKTPKVLFSSTQLRDSSADYHIRAGETTGPPISGGSKNTVLDNGYDGAGSGSLLNQQIGHLWPYNCFSAQMQGTGTVDDGWYPICLDGSGLNGYGVPQFLTTPYMLGSAGGKVVIELNGLVNCLGPDNYRVEIVVARNCRPDWAGGDGGETGSVGAFHPSRAFAFISPSMASGSFAGGAVTIQVRIELAVYYHRQLYARCHFLMGATDGGLTPAIIDTHVTHAFSYGAAITLMEKTSRWGVHFKIDGDAGGFHDVLTVNNTPFGGGGSSPPKAVQDGSACRLQFTHMSATLFPGPD